VIFAKNDSGIAGDMSFETRAPLAPDHPTVSYPGSALRFRAPAGDPTRTHVLCLGGTETFGRFVQHPYPATLADRIAAPVINMGVAGGGLDVVLNDPAIAEARRTASAIVLQVQGAQTLGNRLYTVHPRRNDRFVRASGLLRTIYRDVDFTEFHFNRHMLDHLLSLSPDRFDIVRNELRVAWMGRMTRMLSEALVPVHLLWLSCRAPTGPEPAHRLGKEPLFVTSDMLETVAERAASLTVIAAPNPDPPRAKGLTTEAAAARLLPAAEAHERAADALAKVLEPDQ
jgi:hypothetical protein